jgi:hypothetical protein
MQIRILFRIQGFDEQKLKKYTAGKLFIFFGSKTAVYLSQGLHKRRTSYCTGEALSPHKRTSSISKHKNSSLFLYLRVIFALLDPDPDTATQITADPCGYGIRSRERLSRSTLHLKRGEREVCTLLLCSLATMLSCG